MSAAAQRGERGLHAHTLRQGLPKALNYPPSPAFHATVLFLSQISPEVGSPDRCCCQGLSCLFHHSKHNLPGRYRRHLTAGKPGSAHGRYSW